MNFEVIIAQQLQQIHALTVRLQEYERSAMINSHKANQLQQEVQNLKASNNNLNSKISDAVRALEWSKERVDSLEKNVADLENQLETFQRTNKLESYVNERIEMALNQPGCDPHTAAQLVALKAE